MRITANDCNAGLVSFRCVLAKVGSLARDVFTREGVTPIRTTFIFDRGLGVFLYSCKQ